MNPCSRGPLGAGGGGSFAVVVGTGDVVVVGGTTGTPEDVDVPPVAVVPVVAVVGTVPLDVAGTVLPAVGCAFVVAPPVCDEITTAATAPAAAAAATPTATRSFLTRQEATLARPCPIASKSS
jgi:hypothetical protein